MPPKKKEEPVEKPVLGRFKSNLKVSKSFAPCWRQLVVHACRQGPLSALVWHLQAFRVIVSRKRLFAAQMGIVGLPNVGKSTLFNTLGKVSIPAENFPFCTIEPNNVSSQCAGRPCTDLAVSPDPHRNRLSDLHVQ